MNRREFIRSSQAALLASVSFPLSKALGEDALSIEQKKDFARIFGVDRTFLNALQTVQDIRSNVPFSANAFATDPMVVILGRANKPEEVDFAVVEAWHKLALDLTTLDHAHVLGGNDPIDIYGEQLGPARSSWALGLIHLAIFEAMNVYRNEYMSFRPGGAKVDIRTQIIQNAQVGVPDLILKDGSLSAAASYAALRVIRVLYPKKKAYIQARSDEILKSVRGPGVVIGGAIGESTAAIVLKSRGWSDAYGFSDGSEFPEPLASVFKSNDLKKWQPDPITKNATALGGLWSRVSTFVIPKADAFRADPPPSFDSDEFIEAYKEVKAQGGWGSNVSSDPNSGRFATATTRKGDVDPVPDAQGKVDYANNESFKAVFWAYDGTAYLCAPPRLYFAIATTIARKKLVITDAYEFSRFLAIVALAMADAAISAWDSKYFYLHPRPITYLRAIDADKSIEGSSDPKWTPLGGAVTNGGLDGRNLTPPFPAYPSGHAVFGGAVFEVLRLSLISKSIGDPSFQFLSDEYNGKNFSPAATNTATKPRPRVPVDFPDLSVPEEENGQSRIWMGIHWKHDKKAGIKQGNKVGRFVFNNVFLKTT